MAKPSRRGKNERSAPATASTTTSTNTPEDQIARARAAVEKSRQQATTLHSQWRLHLVRLSYMVVLITIHQLQAPATYCLYDIKSYNKSLTPLDPETMRISGYKAIYYVVKDTLCEFLGFIMGICLTIFLTQMHTASAVMLVHNNASGTTHRDTFYTNLAYMISTGLVPPVLNFYYHHSKQEVKSCLDSVRDQGDRMWTRYTEHEDSLASAVRGFPVVIIFHVIATGCCWFMEMQHNQQNRNLRMLESLKRDLANAREEHATKKKS